MNNFSPSNFFDLTNVSFVEIFEDEEQAWNVVKKISSFLNELFTSGKVKGNYAENVFVDESATVDSTARIIGPAYIGKNSKVGFNTYLRENVLIGANTSVGHACEIKNSIILNNTFISHLNYVGDSIIGNNVNFGGGAKTANLRFDKKNILIKMESEAFETGLNKFGAVVGDGSQIGVNAVLNPGTILSKNCLIYPLTLVSGVYLVGQTVK